MQASHSHFEAFCWAARLLKPASAEAKGAAGVVLVWAVEKPNLNEVFVADMLVLLLLLLLELPGFLV